VSVSARPRLIPVYNTSAEKIAATVRQVYADRVTGSGGGGGGRQPSPEDFMRMLRGGRGGGGNDRRKEAEPEKLTIGVDDRSNSLVVSASDALFNEVKLLVDEIDQPAAEDNVTTRVVTLRNANPQAVQEAIQALIGPEAKSTPIKEEGATQVSQGRDFEGMRRGMEFMQGAGGGFRGPGGGGPGGGGPGGGFQRGGGFGGPGGERGGAERGGGPGGGFQRGGRGGGRGGR
jgi:hypothetical protein